MPQAAAESPYYIIPNLRSLDPTAPQIDLSSHSWIQATVIEDEDIMFGGKALSTWYEEERRRLSSSSLEEERRGRQRVRASYSSHHPHGHHGHSTKHQSSSSSDKKN
jgi:hypothetical protein